MKIITDPDTPNIFSQYLGQDGTDYAQQTQSINAIDDETIRENEPNEIRRIVCYDQPIYDDIRLEADEWLGLTLGVDRATVNTNVAESFDQASILIVDNDSKFEQCTGEKARLFSWNSGLQAF